MNDLAVTGVEAAKCSVREIPLIISEHNKGVAGLKEWGGKLNHFSRILIRKVQSSYFTNFSYTYI